MTTHYDILIIGGGAAGFFTAINIAEKNKSLKIAILERGKEVLTKVKVSGGGRCNVTNSCFIPNDLVKNYPRGEKELRGPFHTFCTGDTMEWFEKRGVPLKIEDDGRVFPVSNNSQTIIDCFLNEAKKHKIEILTGQAVQSIFKTENYFKIDTQNQNYSCKKMVIATGSNPKIWEMLSSLGHTIVPPVPSLFTFNINDKLLENLMGISAQVSIKVQNSNLKSDGALLITHWGLSGPAVLKLSAWGAREFFEKNYQFTISVNWLPHFTEGEIIEQLNQIKLQQPKKQIGKKCPFELSNRLWENLVKTTNSNTNQNWADISKIQIQNLAKQVTASQFKVSGKSTFKEEFVTAGGVNLKEIDFKTMQSKIVPNMYLAGEVLNIDAITGGFNFQNAWTGGFIISESV